MRLRTMLIALVAVASLITACGDDTSGGADGYSEQIRTSYLAGCGSEQNQAFCQCTLDELEKRFSEEEFIKFAVEATEEAPPEFLEIAFACLSEADLGG